MSEDVKNNASESADDVKKSADKGAENERSSDADTKDDSSDSKSSDSSGNGNKSGGGHESKGGADSKDDGGSDGKGSGKSSSGLSIGDAAGIMQENESKGGADTKAQEEMKGGPLSGKKDASGHKKGGLGKRLLAMAQAAFHAITSMLMTVMLAIMQVMLALVFAAVAAVVSAIVTAVVAIVTAVATALGVSVGVAAVAVAGIFLAVVLVVVAVVVVVNNNNTAVKDDVVPCEEVDMDYMEVPDEIPAQAWTNAKLIYTFFRTYGDAVANELGDESAAYSDEMIAAILGNWYHESKIDTTSVETVTDSAQAYSISPLKLWLWQGGVNVSYNWHYDSDDNKVYDDTTVDPYYVMDDGDTVVHFVDPLDTNDDDDDTVTFEDSSDSRGFGVSFSNDFVSHHPILFEVKWIKDLYQTSYWNNFPAIEYMGIGLGQWTNTRNTNLLEYADEKGRQWYELDVQLMYALSEDSGASWLQSWNGTYTENSFVAEIIDNNGTADTDDDTIRTVTYTNGMEYDGEPLETAAVIAYNTSQFLAGWEGVAGNSLDTRIEYAFMWYNIITEWQEGVDYVLGTGSSLWSSLESVGVTASDVTQQSGARSCTDLYFMGNSSLAEAIVSYAWGPTQDDHNKGTLCWQHLFSTMTNGDSYYMSCDRTVAIAVWWSGTDSSYPLGSTYHQLEYLLEKDVTYRAMLSGDTSGGMTDDTAWWMKVDTSNAHTAEEFIALLRPGDILIRNDDYSVPPGYNYNDVGHTLMYVGNEVIRRRFPEADESYVIVSGSLNTRSPSVGQFVFGGFDPDSKGYESYYVFRNMGTYVSEAGRDDVALTCAGHSNEQ